MNISYLNLWIFETGYKEIESIAKYEFNFVNINLQ